MTVYGYIRVSSRDQCEDRQRIALEGFPVPPGNIFSDRQSGKDFNRPSYRRLMRALKQGDLMVIKSIDRLGRNYEEIIDQWRQITKRKGADIAVMDMPLLDTRSGVRDLTGTFIADLVLQILSYVAETERTFLRQRQAEGIAAAKMRGVRFGNAEKALPEEFPLLRDAWRQGTVSARKAAGLLGVSPNTFLRRCRMYP